MNRARSGQTNTLLSLVTTRHHSPVDKPRRSLLRSVVRYCLLGVGVLLFVACGSGDDAAKNKSGGSKPAADKSPASAVDAAPKIDAAAKLACTTKSDCLAKGLAHKLGDKAKLDFALAARYFDRGCTLGGARACLEIADAYELALGVKQDRPRAKTLYRKSCKGDYGRGCASLAVLEARGSTTATDLYALAKPLLTAACSKGILEDCYWLVLVPPIKGGVETMKALDRTCGGGVVPACKYLANWLDRSAKQVFAKYCPGRLTVACADRVPAADKSVANSYITRLNFVRERITKMCKDDDLQACRYVRDKVRFPRIADKRCAAGDYGACYELVAFEPKRTAALLERACGAKLVMACDRLGDYYRDDDKKADMAKAKKFYSLACDYGRLPSCAKLKQPQLGGGCAGLKPSASNKLLGPIPAPARELEGTTISGEKFKLSAHRGKVVLLFVSGEFHPRLSGDLLELLTLKKKLAGTKFEIVVLVSTNSEAKLGKHASSIESLRVIVDISNDVGPKSHAVGVKLVPETLLIDGKGQVRVYLQNDRDLGSLKMQRCVRSLLP